MNLPKKENTSLNSKAVLLVFSGLSVGYIVYKLQKHFLSKHGSIPMAKNQEPYIGHTRFVLKNWENIHEIASKINMEAAKENDAICLNFPRFYEIVLLTPQLVDWVFTKKFDTFLKTDRNVEHFLEFFGGYGKGIFFSDGKEWRFHRKIGSRMFSLRNIKDYMFSCCVRTTKSTLNVLERLRSSNSTIDINDLFGRMTFDCFTSIAFGTEFDSMSLYPKPHPFGVAFDQAMGLMPQRIFDSFWKVKRFFNVGREAVLKHCAAEIDNFSNDILESRKKSKANLTDESGKKTFDLLSLYLDHKPDLSNQDLKFISLHFIIAGRDTTRMLLSWFFYDLTQHPEVKEKIVKEILQNKEGLSYDVVANNMKFTEAALCESLRMHPVVPSSARYCVKDIKVPKEVSTKNYSFKKGDRVIIHHHSINKSPKFFNEPDKYNPMRFYKKGVRTFMPNVFTYFNLPPRLCLGRDFALMEAKTFVCEFFKHYDFDLVEGQKIEGTPGVIFNMKNGMKINLYKM